MTAPLLTLNTSLQQSVVKNVVTISDFQLKPTEGSKSAKARTSSLGVDRSLRFGFLNMRNKQSLSQTN